MLSLLVGVLAVSTASIFIRLAQGEVDALAIAAYRLTLATLLLMPVVLIRYRLRTIENRWTDFMENHPGWFLISCPFCCLDYIITIYQCYQLSCLGDYHAIVGNNIRFLNSKRKSIEFRYPWIGCGTHREYSGWALE